MHFNMRIFGNFCSSLPVFGLSLFMLNGFASIPAISGEVIHLREQIIFMKNDGITKKVITDGRRVIVLDNVGTSAYPKAGGRPDQFYGGSLAGDKEFNRTIQDSFYKLQKISVPDNYRGSDSIAEMYGYYINLRGGSF